MDSEKDKGGRPSNDEIAARREKVRDLMLQGYSYREIEQALAIASSTVYADIMYWKEYFSRMAADNPEVAKATYTKVQEALSEIDMVKKQYWARYQKLLKNEEEQEQAIALWKQEMQALKAEYQSAVDAKDRAEMRRLEKKLKEAKPPRFFSYHKNLLETLKLIMDRIDKEAKLLNLFNPNIGQQSQRNGLSWDTFKAVMIVFKQIILDFIPEAQRPYAFQRLRRVKLDELKPEDIVDAQIVEAEPKVGLTRIEAPVEAPLAPEQTITPEHDQTCAPLPPKQEKKTETVDDKGLEDLDI